MKVLKFGGTSIGSASRIKKVADLICDGEKKIVVLSAMSGTTDALIEISGYFHKRNKDCALERINSLEQEYKQTVSELYATEIYRKECKDIIEFHFESLRSFSQSAFTVADEKEILTLGEILSTLMMHLYLQENKVNSALIPALEFIRIDINFEPNTSFIAENIKKYLDENSFAEIIITQGYICRNFYGEIDNLQRGGSDYTASLIGSAVDAEEIQIWTDIDGIHNNDPRFVENTKPVHLLNFEEAAELAYFGAKILHPTCILPAKLKNIPVRLLSTLEPTAEGTYISNFTEKGTIKAVAAKDNITAINIKSGQMLLAYGFLRKVFEIFESYQTSIDMITTSEVGVSLTIDDDKHLEEIVEDLRKFGSVSVTNNMTILCVVGDMHYINTGLKSKAIDALNKIPMLMISYGGSDNNISFLINSKNKIAALNSLSKELFKD